MKIILASASPRRRELLSQARIRFQVVPGDIEEVMKGDTPEEIVRSLAEQKAEAVFNTLCRNADGLADLSDGEDFMVIGADTIVACDGCRLGKPADEAEALAMLKRLGGRKHEVYTGVAIYTRRNGAAERQVFCECTKVDMYPISDDQARWYIRSREPMDKAGAYGIQGLGAVFIRGIEGDYYNVVGLPLAKVWHIIRQNEDV